MAVRSVTLTWTGNGGDGFTIQRKDGHLLVPGTFVDIAHVVSGESFVDPASPLPYATYRVRATLAGASDSPNSNEAGSDLPHRVAQPHGLSRR